MYGITFVIFGLIIAGLAINSEKPEILDALEDEFFGRDENGL